MAHENRTEVLVVGAGPVGMLTALALSHAGVQVHIIDQEWRTTSRTYACALHSRTLKLLDQFGIARDVLAAGRVIDSVGFYEGEKRRGEAKLSQLKAEFPFLVVLPQSVFEQLLETKLKKDGTVEVHWNRQLTGLGMESDSVVASVDHLAVSAKGYSIPEMEISVQRTETIRANYVIGADGPNSIVARELNPGFETVGESEFFAVYEFQSDWENNKELQIVLHKDTTSVLWPLAGNRFRWSFQLRQEHLQDFPMKERKSLLIGDPEADRANRQFIDRLLRERAPWFKGTIQEVGWSTDVEFQHRVAKSFGNLRCWLAGDAAHQTGPAAMQSMNLGLLEGPHLAEAIIQVLRAKGSPGLLRAYDEMCRTVWRQMLGLNGAPRGLPGVDPWVQQRGARILACLPASGDDLHQLLHQLHLEVL